MAEATSIAMLSRVKKPRKIPYVPAVYIFAMLNLEQWKDTALGKKDVALNQNLSGVDKQEVKVQLWCLARFSEHIIYSNYNILFTILCSYVILKKITMCLLFTCYYFSAPVALIDLVQGSILP